MTPVLLTNKQGGQFDRWRSMRIQAGTQDGLPAQRLDHLLVSTIHPALAGELASGTIDCWYAMRLRNSSMSDRRQHLWLRLRLAAAEGQAAEDWSTGDKAITELGAQIEAVLLGGSVFESPDQWEASRFGGSAGLVLCEQALAAASGAVVATIRDNRSRARRLSVAAGLLLASAWATGADWQDIVGWLRGGYQHWPRGDAAAVDHSAARAAAEAAYVRNQADWLDQPNRVREAIVASNSVVGRWHRQQSQTWAELVALAEAGRLDRTPAAVFHDLVHVMMHQQLGLELADEAYIAWLLSLSLAVGRMREPFFTDTLAASDRQMHEQSKYYLFRGEDQRAEESLGVHQGRQELPQAEEVIALTRPSGVNETAPRLEEVLLARRSTHGRYHGQFTINELSTLLYYAAGATGDKPLPGNDTSYRVRTYPSGGARYPVRLLLYCHEVAGLTRGAYLYDAERHTLARLSSRDISAELMQTSPWLDLRMMPPKATGRIDAAACPLWIFPIGDLTYQRLAYGLRAYRLMLVECGHLAQNLSLVATWLGRFCIGLGGYFDDAVNQLMDVDGVNTSVLYIYLVGDVAPAD